MGVWEGWMRTGAYKQERGTWLHANVLWGGASFVGIKGGDHCRCAEVAFSVTYVVFWARATPYTAAGIRASGVGHVPDADVGWSLRPSQMRSGQILEPLAGSLGGEPPAASCIL